MDRFGPKLSNLLRALFCLNFLIYLKIYFIAKFNYNNFLLLETYMLTYDEIKEQIGERPVTLQNQYQIIDDEGILRTFDDIEDAELIKEHTNKLK